MHWCCAQHWEHSVNENKWGAIFHLWDSLKTWTTSHVNMWTSISSQVLPQGLLLQFLGMYILPDSFPPSSLVVFSCDRGTHTYSLGRAAEKHSVLWRHITDLACKWGRFFFSAKIGLYCMNKLYNYNQEYIVSHIKKLLNKTKLRALKINSNQWKKS